MNMPRTDAILLLHRLAGLIFLYLSFVKNSIIPNGIVNIMSIFFNKKYTYY